MSAYGTDPRATTAERRKFRAFISYSHAADDRLAPALQSGLHRFAKPWYKLRAMRVFRDKTGLAVTPALWGSIQKALADADYFILLASPQAAQSEWVGQEIDWWLRNRSTGHFLIVWTDGELAWNPAEADFDWSRTTALPLRLEKAFQEEPNHLDMRFARTSAHLTLRHPKFLEAIAGLSATLQDRSLDELIGQDLEQHRKAIRLLRFASLGSLLLAIAAGVALFVAQQAKSTADKLADGLESTARQQVREALSREVAERSAAALPSDRDLAILLAVQANCAHPGDEAASALRQSLFEPSSPKAVLKGHVDGSYYAAFSPDGQRLVTGGADGSARVWEPRSGEVVLELPGHSGGVTGVDVSPDGTRIVTSSWYDPTARVWDAASGSKLFDLRHEPLPQGLAVARFSPDGNQVLTMAKQGDAVLWDASSGQRLRNLASSYAQSRGASTLQSITFSPDGSRVALVDWGPAVVDAATGQSVFELDGHGKEVFDIDYSPDGRLLVTASKDRSARVWSASTGKSIAVLPHDAGVSRAIFGAGGRWIVTGTEERVLSVWDAASHKRLAEVDIRPNALASFALSADGNFLATGAEEHAVAVFETRTGARVAELTGHTGPVRSVAFSPDGKHVVSAGLDGNVTIHAFDLGEVAGQLLSIARNRVPRQLTAQERAKYLPASFSQQVSACP